MYVAHFRLRELPFSIAPDPAFLYLSSRHREALAHLLYGTAQHGSFTLLTGEVGLGKTTLVRAALQQELGKTDVAVILNPWRSETELLSAICDELQVRRDGPEVTDLMPVLHQHLLKTRTAGRHTILALDEVQDLDGPALQLLRRLSELEAGGSKLLGILLCGQPELVERLAEPDLLQFARSIVTRYHLTPLTEPETTDYIAHRLRVAGAATGLFTDLALPKVHGYSRGVPRQINIVCDRALLGAYAEGLRTVTPGIVDRAAAEVFGPTRHPLPSLDQTEVASAPGRFSSIPPLRWIPGGSAIAALILVGLVLNESLSGHAPYRAKPTPALPSSPITAVPAPQTGEAHGFAPRRATAMAGSADPPRPESPPHSTQEDNGSHKVAASPAIAIIEDGSRIVTLNDVYEETPPSPKAEVHSKPADRKAIQPPLSPQQTQPPSPSLAADEPAPLYRPQRPPVVVMQYGMVSSVAPSTNSSPPLASPQARHFPPPPTITIPLYDGALPAPARGANAQAPNDTSGISETAPGAQRSN